MSPHDKSSPSHSPESARVVAELRQTQEQMRAELDATNRLLAIGSLFVKEGAIEPVLAAIVHAAIGISGADCATLQLLDPESGDLQIAAHEGVPVWWVEFWNRVSTGQGACGTALGRRQRVIVEDVENDPIFWGARLDAMRQAGMRAVQSTPLLGRAGEPIGMLSTHQRSAGRPGDRALRLLDLLCRQAADILGRVRAERALEEANRRLLESDRRKDQFLALLSHELRNPLAPIRNSVTILERAQPGSQQALRALAVIGRQLGHMTRLIEDLLDVTRITSGKVRLQRELLDLNELLQRVVDDHRGSFVEGGVELSMLAAKGPVWVEGDRTRLTQAIGNLLQNAVKFTPPGGRTTISVEEDATHQRALVRVHDTGRGILPEMLPRLFEPFTQADSTLDRSQGGLGLGLALAKGLVEMQGGTVRAESRGANRGATFTVTLPLETPGPVETIPPASGRAETTRRILVIEDNTDGADTLRELLQFDGHEVEVAYSGPAGVEKARRFRPDIVLCDIGLPGMDGYQVATAIRADPEVGAVSLVALSGYACEEDVAKAKATGFNAHIAKPPSMESLQRVLQEFGTSPRAP